MRRASLLGLALALFVVGTACGLSSLGQGGAPGDGRTASPEPTEAPMLPVSINEGLASLDSYRMTYTSDTFDSASQQREVATFVVARDRASDASYSRNETASSSEGSDLAQSDVQEQYVIGHGLCQVSGGEAEFTPVSETARVLGDLMSQVVSFHPLIENPVLVGEETVNGVPVRSYTFELTSLGASTDVEVSRADGRYSIATDGDYLVRYGLDLELRTGAADDPQAESSTFHIDLSLEDINQPVAIVFPEACQEAAGTPAPAP